MAPRRRPVIRSLAGDASNSPTARGPPRLYLGAAVGLSADFGVYWALAALPLAGISINWGVYWEPPAAGDVAGSRTGARVSTSRAFATINPCAHWWKLHGCPVLAIGQHGGERATGKRHSWRARNLSEPRRQTARWTRERAAITREPSCRLPRFFCACSRRPAFRLAVACCATLVTSRYQGARPPGQRHPAQPMPKRSVARPSTFASRSASPLRTTIPTTSPLSGGSISIWTGR